MGGRAYYPCSFEASNDPTVILIRAVCNRGQANAFDIYNRSPGVRVRALHARISRRLQRKSDQSRPRTIAEGADSSARLSDPT